MGIPQIFRLAWARWVRSRLMNPKIPVEMSNLTLETVFYKINLWSKKSPPQGGGVSRKSQKTFFRNPINSSVTWFCVNASLSNGCASRTRITFFGQNPDLSAKSRIWSPKAGFSLILDGICLGNASKNLLRGATMPKNMFWLTKTTWGLPRNRWEP